MQTPHQYKNYLDVPSFSLGWFLLLALSALWCSACISQVNDTGALPFEEKIVIRGLLIAGESARNIQISRTIPILNDINDSAFAVRDAQAFILTQGRQFQLTLQNDSDTDSTRQRSLYEAKGLTIQERQQYEIIVRWNGKTATAVTTIPVTPRIVAARLIEVLRPIVTSGTITPGQPPRLQTLTDTLLAADIRIRSRTNLAYNAAIQIHNETTQTFSPLYIGETFFIDALAADSIYSITSGRIPSQTRKLLTEPNVLPVVTIFAYDEPYYRYILTRDRARQAASPLGGAGENVAWNIQGDGIGLFIGVALASLALPK
jgi:hypothetical protein